MGVCVRNELCGRESEQRAELYIYGNKRIWLQNTFVPSNLSSRKGTATHQTSQVRTNSVLLIKGSLSGSSGNSSLD
jgi:hypothetical protein